MQPVIPRSAACCAVRRTSRRQNGSAESQVSHEHNKHAPIDLDPKCLRPYHQPHRVRPRAGHPPMGSAMVIEPSRRAYLPPLAAQRHPVQRRQRRGPLVHGLRARLRRPHLDDVPTGARARRARAQGRKRHARCLRQLVQGRWQHQVDDGSEETGREVHYLKGYTVFNVEQIEGLPAQSATQVTASEPNASAAIASAQRLATATQASIRHGGAHAFYDPRGDAIHMPPFEAFRDAESYAAVLLHELTHWTAHPSRLARELANRFGDAAYAAEELVAELGAAFLCADLGITLEPREDHASYISVWLKVLRGDQRAIFTAASQAQRAAQFLQALSPAQER